MHLPLLLILPLHVSFGILLIRLICLSVPAPHPWLCLSQKAADLKPKVEQWMPHMVGSSYSWQTPPKDQELTIHKVNKQVPLSPLPSHPCHLHLHLQGRQPTTTSPATGVSTPLSSCSQSRVSCPSPLAGGCGSSSVANSSIDGDGAIPDAIPSKPSPTSPLSWWWTHVSQLNGGLLLIWMDDSSSRGGFVSSAPSGSCTWWASVFLSPTAPPQLNLVPSLLEHARLAFVCTGYKSLHCLLFCMLRIQVTSAKWNKFGHWKPAASHSADSSPCPLLAAGEL